MINLGIIGLGPVWENRYRPVLTKLQHRIRIRAIYDSVAGRCVQAAQEFQAVPYEGALSLLTQADVRGVLVLDTAWHGNVLLHFLRKSRKPAYIAGSLGDDRDELSRLRNLVESEGLLMMPEFSRRFTPATCRLHELIATKLGRPRHIAIDAVPPAADAEDVVPGQTAGTDFLIGLLDWCHYVVRSSSVRLEARPLYPDSPPGPSSSNQDESQAIAIEFSESRDRARRPTAELRLNNAGGPHGPGRTSTPHLCFTVLCEKGEAVIEGPEQIRWASTGGKTATESLTADRSEVEVMIDHFCRRLVGGLVPIADISDVCRCLRLVQAASDSLTARAPVELKGYFG
jgi:predicted dehydrogenase